MVGPNARFDGNAGGVEWRPPPTARTLLLAGDETAVPAIASILEGLPPTARARALLEVPATADVLPLRVGAGVQVTWLPRQDGGVAHPHGAPLEEAVRWNAAGLAGARPATHVEDLDTDNPVWDVPSAADGAAASYVWLAGEAGVVVRLRRHLLREVGLPRTAVAFMGYWRQGRAEPN